MSRNNPLRPVTPMVDLPGIVTAHPDECRGVTEAPEFMFISVELEWTDGHRETGTGVAKAWTRTAVLVDVYASRGHYYAWVMAGQVSRRTPG